MKRYRTTILLALMAVCVLHATAKSIEGIFVEAGTGVSRVIPTNAFLRSSHDNAMSINADLRAGFRFAPSTKYGRLYPNVRQGLSLNVLGFAPHSSFGTPFGSCLFQDITLTENKRWRVDFGWNFGVSAPWRHFDLSTTPINTAIGSKVNAILGINAALLYKVSNQWALRLALTARHYSNGNTAAPNSGVNTAGLEVGASYMLNHQESRRTIKPSAEDFKPGMSYDITVYGAQRSRIAPDNYGSPIVLPGKFGVAGLCFAPMYNINKYVRAGVSADVQYDESANISRHLVDGTYGENVKFYRQPFSERLSAGLSLRAELTLAMFGINFGVGRNIIARGESKVFYQTLTLKIYLPRRTFINIGYRLSEFHDPENLMLGVGFSFGQ